MADSARPDEAVSAVRTAVRRLITTARKAGHLADGQLAVAVSGGADSLALAAAAQHQSRRLGLTVHGLIVDHGLQPGSDKVAAVAADQLTDLGLRAQVLTVDVDGPGGMEAAARRARYAALRGALPAPDAIVLLGHTRDDQAETVLLGLGRGSGPRSIAGMRPLDPPWGRPLLAVTRAQTERACTAQGLTWWSDPHNADPSFTRVRLRQEVLPLLEDVLRGGVADALARTAAQLREDNDALDAIAAELLVGDPAELAVEALAGTPAAIRRRVLRTWLRRRGVTELTDAQLRDVDALIGEWRGQGGVLLRGGLVAQRAHGRLQLDRASP
ncbi:tRNA lysidine(34) synthetase TilS [Kutzneria buriramensis]|uniref:tRNA(Ile)-lysidine synthase n=1 Tax=Kutzneria buriramensis TaxID=1045776 RepID=A0A3E0HUX6_9PSEU|nr:tRNA lysidine(34) synthetase TilS [Kutzneria buriramensis]REH50219.1 tRNA(Ile)-lysidine synthase [Kutzneria buriramensis]